MVEPASPAAKRGDIRCDDHLNSRSTGRSRRANARAHLGAQSGGVWLDTHLCGSRQQRLRDQASADDDQAHRQQRQIDPPQLSQCGRERQESQHE